MSQFFLCLKSKWHNEEKIWTWESPYNGLELWSIFKLECQWLVRVWTQRWRKDYSTCTLFWCTLIEPKEGVPICKLHVTCSGHKYNYLSFGMMIAISFPLPCWKVTPGWPRTSLIVIVITIALSMSLDNDNLFGLWITNILTSFTITLYKWIF